MRFLYEVINFQLKNEKILSHLLYLRCYRWQASMPNRVVSPRLRRYTIRHERFTRRHSVVITISLQRNLML